MRVVNKINVARLIFCSIAIALRNFDSQIDIKDIVG